MSLLRVIWMTSLLATGPVSQRPQIRSDSPAMPRYALETIRFSA